MGAVVVKCLMGGDKARGLAKEMALAEAGHVCGRVVVLLPLDLIGGRIELAPLGVPPWHVGLASARKSEQGLCCIPRRPQVQAGAWSGASDRGSLRDCVQVPLLYTG